MRRLTGMEAIQKALENMEKESSEKEMENAISELAGHFENPVAVTLKDYMEGVYEIAEEEVKDWIDYIDFARYLNDFSGEESEDLLIAETDSGYCVIYEDLPDEELDEDYVDEEECCDEEEECPHCKK
ncbi:hypothetical protein LLG10_08070 [bacterium]|nr:hypothetical protein [bacterium]